MKSIRLMLGVIIFAWVYELSASGVKRTSPFTSVKRVKSEADSLSVSQSSLPTPRSKKTLEQLKYILKKNNLQNSDSKAQVQAELKAQNFYARMGTSLQAVVDALSKISSATIQKIMDYLYGSKKKINSVDLNFDGDIELTAVSSFKKVLESSPVDAAIEIAGLPAAQAARVVQIVTQGPELQVGPGKPNEQLLSQAGVEPKSGSITMPVQKFAVSDPIVQAGSGRPFMKPDQKIVLDVKKQEGSETLPVEEVQSVDVQQQQKDVIQKDFNSGMLLQEQLKIAEKQKKDLAVFSRKQSKKGKFSDANNAVKTLSVRIKLLKEQIAQEKILNKKMKDDADVLPDVRGVFGKKSQEQTQERNPMKSVRVDEIPAPTKPVEDEPKVVSDLKFETLYKDQKQNELINPMKPVLVDEIPAPTKPVVDEPEVVSDLNSKQMLQKRYQGYAKPDKLAKSPNYESTTYKQILTDVSLVGSDAQSGRLTKSILHNPSVNRKINVSQLPSRWSARKSVTEENFEPVVLDRSLSLDDFK